LIQDDFIALSEVQELRVKQAIQVQKQMHPRPVVQTDNLSNIAKVALAKMKIVKCSIRYQEAKRADNKKKLEEAQRNAA